MLFREYRRGRGHHHTTAVLPNTKRMILLLSKEVFRVLFQLNGSAKNETHSDEETTKWMHTNGYIVILCVIRAREKERRTYNVIRLRCCWKTTGAKVIRLNTLNVLIAVAIAHVSLKTFSMGRNCTYIVFRLLPLPPNDFLFLFVSLFFCFLSFLRFNLTL